MLRFIAIEGNIGAGKTTLAIRLAEALGAACVLEQFAENNFLPKFYADPERYALPLELSFLADRYKQQKEAFGPASDNPGTTVSDYLLVKSRLFARINLDDAEYDLFSRVYDVMDLHLPPPDVLIYLHAPVETLQDHIRSRGRDYEQNIEDNYLRRITLMYEEYLAQIGIPVIMIDTSKVNAGTDAVQLKRLLTLLSGPLAVKRHYLAE